MKVTREIGLRYLWIDSLCIVQGDPEEWHQESTKMGSVYENAYLVIAAADASDSRGGCFFQRKRKRAPHLIKIPYQDKSGTTMGLLYVGLDNEIPVANENEGPLAKRAWITQEWLLARRMAFFTRNGLIWSCKSIRSDASITNHEPNLTRKLDWQFIIKTHTSRKLTYFTDRLISLEGIRTEMQAKSGGRYEHGVFEKHLQSQLIWQVHGKHSAKRKQNPLQMPSWSWASSMARVDFLSGEDNPLVGEGRNGEEVDCGDIRFDNDGDAIIVPAGRIRILKPSDWEDWDDFFLDSDDYTDSTPSDLEDGHSDGVNSAEEDCYSVSSDPQFNDDADKIEAENASASEDEVELDSDTSCYIMFDECKTPDLKQGRVIALLLVQRHMAFAGNEEVFEEYFVILQPCAIAGGVSNNTYVRVGAGYYTHNWRYVRDYAFKNRETKSLRII
jgi:hypothetical protein